jgi:hypothetical protein
MALQTANQFQLNTDFSRLGTGIQQGQKIASQFQAGQDRKAKLGQAQQATQLSGQALGGNSEALGGLAAIDPARANQIQTYLSSLSEADRIEDARENKIMTQTALNALTLPEGGRRNYLQQQRDAAANDGRNTDKIDAALEGDNASLTQALNFQAREGQTVESLYNAQFPEDAKATSPLDQAKINNLNAEASMFKGGANTKDLDNLVSKASPELQEQAKSAYSLSGGGDKGVKAAQEVLESGVESERRANAPELLKANFPQADEAELLELQAVVDSSKTTESGFKEAGKLRDKQRQVKKGKVFQKRAVDLLDRILANTETGDVTGSLEGGESMFANLLLSDGESQAIADIGEAGDILTADNLDIMTGVLSETDINIIKNLAGGALNRKRGDKAFRDDITELRERLAGKLGVLPKGVTEDDITTTMEANNLSREQVLDRLRRK